jgi:diguanylate cyclase (GGDEF)-like protein
MSDSQTPHDDPVPAHSYAAGSPAGETHDGNGAVEAESRPTEAPLRPRSHSRLAGMRLRDFNLRQLLDGRRAVWAAIAVLCVAGGVIGSLLVAHTVAHNDTTSAQQASQQSSAAIASTVKLTLLREEDLRIGGSTYFAGNSRTTPAEFDRWAHWARTLRHFPELEQLGLVALVHGSELPAFAARVSGQASPASTTSAAAGASATATTAPQLKITPAGARPFYCVTLANLARHPNENPPAGSDYCAKGTALLVARDSAQTGTAVVSAEDATALEMTTPVYKGNQPPATLGGRMGAFVGWLRQVFVPSVLLESALRSHPADAVRVSYSNGPARVVYTGGTPQPGAPSTTTNLRDGWTVQGFGTAVSTGMLSDGNALALLILGGVLSALLGMLVFVLGTGRPQETVAAETPNAPEETPEAPAEDLHDALTGLPNRALMLDRAECMLARAGRQSGLLVGALFIDIDWFTDVNERLGEVAGDQILKIVAERLEAVVRAGDTVGRLGDDEFVLLVESAARGARLDNLARRVVEALHKPFELDGFGPSFFLTASIGVAFGRYATPEDLLRDAQLALHAAKSAGKDRYTLFNANMRSVIEGRGDLEAELNAALTDKQFFLLYEPIYDVATGRVAGLEALIRWLHPKRGVMLPADFIPLAEETGLTVPIGRGMLEEACTRAAAWNVAGHEVGVSVEVTANQLNRDGFATDVRRALQQSGIEPSLLTLEIAETTVMRDVNAAVERLGEVKQLGVRVAIDDFGGSGYAYHSDLRRLPLDFLKVDRSSLAASEDEEYRTWLLEAILIVGRDLSLTVIAEGIDSYEQLSDLQGMGCTMAQGTLMGKAVPANALENVFSVSLPLPRVDAQDSPGRHDTPDVESASEAQSAPDAPDAESAPEIQSAPDPQSA